jgi:nitrite reductase (NO-forming)
VRRTIFALLTIVGLSSSVALLHVHAQQADQATGINIVEPPFQSPQQWTYDPIDITVPQGATVTWANTGAVAHTVTSDDGTSFDSGSLDPQMTFSLNTDTPGSVTYHCTFHPWMKGTLTVTP